MSMRRYVLALLALVFCGIAAPAYATCPTDTGSAATTDLTIIRDTMKEICNNGIPNTGSGAVTIAGGADVAEGQIGDTSTQGTVLGFLSSLFNNTVGLADESPSSGQKWSKVGCNVTTAAPTYTTTKSDPLNCTPRGGVRHDLDSVGGTAIDTNSGNKSAGTQRVVIATDQPAVATNPQASTTGGCTDYHLAGGSAASTNSTSVKGSAGTLCGGLVMNTTSTVYYFRLYNSASAPTCSSATGASFSVPIPPSTAGYGTALSFGSFGVNYGTGIGFCLTGGGGDTDNTNAATGVFVNLAYK
jgi:hypothetical protein